MAGKPEFRPTVLLNVIERKPEVEISRPPVVFLHGLYGRARNLGSFQRRIAEKRRTLAIDLRNHGDSPHGPGNYPAMTQDVAETMMAHHAIPAAIMGHSMGGKVAMLLALEHPELVSSLVIGDMAPARTGHGQGKLALNLLQLKFPKRLDRAGANDLLSTVVESQQVRDLLLQNVRLGDDPGWTMGLQDIAESIANIENWPYVPEGHVYDGPVLFIRGENSPYISEKHFDVMKKLFPNHRLETMRKVGHWLHAEDPKTFSSYLTTFLDAY